MTRFIRWQGTITFVVLIALIVTFFYFFADSLLKKAIVNSAETAFGAEVNITDVELTFSPLAFKVVDLQVTDKEAPSQNLFSFKQAAAAVDVWQYLFGKIIIDKLEVSELAFGEVRAKPGKVYQDKIGSKQEASFSDKAKAMLPEVDMKLPDVKTLLNDSNLLTVKASEDLKASYKTEQAKLNALKEKLPNKDKVNYYKDKVKTLSKINVKSLDDVARISKEYETLKAEFKADQALIKKAKQQVIASKKLLIEQSKTLKEAPAKDWQIIEKKYQLESVDSEDFAHIIFGEQARGYFQKAQWLYEKVAPLMEGNGDEASEEAIKAHAKGRFVYFKEDNPLPSFLIKQALLSMSIEQSNYTIEATELTHQHWYRGKDSIIDISSNSNGELDVITRFKIDEAGKLIADGNWGINKRTLNETSLTKTKALTLTIDNAQMNGEGTFTILGKEVLADNHLSLNNASYQGAGSTKLTNLLVDTVKSLDKLTIDVDVTGDINAPDLSIGSSLNKALTEAFKKQVSTKVDEFKGKVNKGLNDKLSAALELGDSQYSELVDLEALLTDTDKTLEDLKNSDVVKQQKQKLKDKLKNKAKDKAKDKLKDKLGDMFG